MITEYYSTARQNFKKICDTVVQQDEDVIIVRKNHDNVVIISMDKYSQFMKLKELHQKMDMDEL